MSTDYRLPRRKLNPNTVLAYSFPEDKPTYWGPNQRILEDDVYVEPSGWKFNETLSHPYVVRFIHDAHEEEATPEPSCTYELGHVYESFGPIPVIAAGYRRKIGTRMAGDAYWLDHPGAYLNESMESPGRGQSQYHSGIDLSLIIVQPDISVKYPDGSTATVAFAAAYPDHVEISNLTLFWRWYNASLDFIGETYRYVNGPFTPGSLPGMDLDPRCPEDYFTGCPCLP